MKVRKIEWECPVCQTGYIEVVLSDVTVTVPIVGLSHSSDDIELDIANSDIEVNGNRIYRCSKCGHIIVEGNDEDFIKEIADDVARRPTVWNKK